jgi:UDP-N-acetylglucosamine--N-acetylmuramyl-(pentapeptide) pyrophosphoryl-undecaprenol N-acetylglucosamine transferase
VLVVGGSLGAKALNEIVPAALAMVGRSLEVRQQTGEAMLAETRARYDQVGLMAEVTAFMQDMAEAYQWAHLAICRSGAMTVSELAAAGLPAVLVPYPYAIDDHQTANALFMVEAGAAELMPQPRFTAESLASLIRGWLDTPDKLAEMGERAQRLATPAAASMVANLCLDKARNPDQGAAT